MRPATGIDGFYPVTVTPEGLLSGASWRGAWLEGRVSGGEVTGEIAPPEGEAVPFEALPSIEEDEYRWIFFDGRLKGAKKGRSAGFMGKDIEL